MRLWTRTELRQELRLFVCPAFLPEKTNLTFQRSESRRIRLLRFPSGAAVIQHRFFRETDVCRF